MVIFVYLKKSQPELLKVFLIWILLYLIIFYHFIDINSTRGKMQINIFHNAFKTWMSISYLMIHKTLLSEIFNIVWIKMVVVIVQVFFLQHSLWISLFKCWISSLLILRNISFVFSAIFNILLGNLKIRKNMKRSWQEWIGLKLSK